MDLITVDLEDEKDGQQKMVIVSGKIIKEEDFIVCVQRFFTREGYETKPVANDESCFIAENKSQNESLIVTITVEEREIAGPPYRSFITVNKNC